MTIASNVQQKVGGSCFNQCTAWPFLHHLERVTKNYICTV